ncbi:MAG: helix-turn-helix transcriptional regulator [Planctomycetota bacterium]
MGTITPEQQDVRNRRGSALRRARKAAGLTAPQLAQRVSEQTPGNAVSHHALYSYEQGKVLLSREVGQRLATVLHIHPGHLLLGDPDYDEPPAPGNLASTPPDPAETVSQLLEQPSKLPRGLMALIDNAARAAQAGAVLVRLLRTARLDQVDHRGYVQVFHLLMGDLEAARDSRAWAAVAEAGNEAGNEEPWRLTQAMGSVYETTRDLLGRLVDPRGETPTVFYDRLTRETETLQHGLREMTAAAARCERSTAGLAE